MKTNVYSKLAIVAFTAIAFAGTASAQTIYYLDSGQAGYTSTNWNIPADWNSAPDGTGTKPPGSNLSSSDNFDLNGEEVGTPSNASAFNGNSITLDGGTLNLRNGGVKTVTDLIGTGNGTIEFNSTTQTLADTTFANSGTTTFTPVGGSLALTLDLGTLTGSGAFTLGGGTSISYNLTITSGTGYTGNITVGGGSHLATLQFGSEGEDFGGGLIATNAASRIDLTEDVTFSSLTLNGTSLAAGTYSYSTLESLDSTVFAGSTGGSITVAAPEPSTYVMMLGGLTMLAVWARRRLA